MTEKVLRDGSQSVFMTADLIIRVCVLVSEMNNYNDRQLFKRINGHESAAAAGYGAAAMFRVCHHMVIIPGWLHFDPVRVRASN